MVKYVLILSKGSIFKKVFCSFDYFFCSNFLSKCSTIIVNSIFCYSEAKAKSAKKPKSAESEVKSTSTKPVVISSKEGLAKDGKDSSKPRSPHKTHLKEEKKPHHHNSSSSSRSPQKSSSSKHTSGTSSSHNSHKSSSHHHPTSSSKPASNNSSPVKKETLSFKLAPINLISSTEQQNALNSSSSAGGGGGGSASSSHPNSATSSPVKKKQVSHERENASKLFPRTTGMAPLASAAASAPSQADAAAAAAKKAALLARLQAAPNPCKEATTDLLGSIMSQMKKN